MKHNIKNRKKQPFMNMKLLLLVVGIGMLLLVGCGSSGLGEDAAATTATVQADQGQEVASGQDPEETSATLPPPIVVEASNTPVPVTNTPEATATPENTSTPEVTEVPPTETPAPTSTAAPVQPTNPPPPPPTATPEPPPPPPPQKGANGLVASHFALQERSDYSVGGSVWYEFTVANSTGGEVSYNALGVMPKKDGVDRFEWYQQTYGGQNSTIKPGGLTWEDRIKLPEPGSYTLRLVICFDGFDNCLQGGGTWQTLSDEIGIQIN